MDFKRRLTARMAGGRRQFGYQLHETTQRLLCRLAFVLLGFMPLIACSLFAAAQYFPGYQRWRAEQAESWLAQQLGLDVEIAAVESKSPTHYALHGVRFIHPESRAAIGRVRQIDVQLRRGQRLVHMREPELEGRQLAATWKIVHDWFLCRPQRYAHMAAFTMDQLTVRGMLDVDTISDIAVKMLPSENALLLEIDFVLNHALASQPSTASQLIIRRDHRENQLLTDIQLRSTVPLPCALVAGLVPQVQRLGQYATFSGVLDFHLRNASWEASLTNSSFQQIDFGQLSQDTGAGISAMGRIDLKQAIVADHYVKYADGSVRLGPGRIDSALLRAMGEHMGVELRLTNSVSVHAFDAAGWYVRIHPQGMQLAGGLGPAGDALFTDGLGGLAKRSPVKWEESIAFEQVVSTLNAANSSAGTTSFSLAARSALQWLPSESSVQRTARNAMVGVSGTGPATGTVSPAAASPPHP